MNKVVSDIEAQMETVHGGAYRAMKNAINEIKRLTFIIQDKPSFDEWFDDNEAQFMADSCHMSEYHMAHLVWNAYFLTLARILAESERAS